MRGLLVLVVLVAASRAAANPITVDELRALQTTLAEHHAEPVGLLVKADLPKLGLVKGDVVVSINGMFAADPLSMRMIESTSFAHLEVVRGGKPVSLKLAVKPPAIESERERSEVKAWARGEGRSALRDVTRQGAPSGVLVIDPVFFGVRGPRPGDIVRKLEGKPVTTIDQLIAHLSAHATKPKLVFDVERAGQPYTYTMVLVDALADDPDYEALLDKIEKVSDTSYKIPRKLVDKLLANPAGMKKGARFVPAMKNGKPEGIKLYAIRPASVYARIGLSNGDTITSLNGVILDGMDKLLDSVTRLKGATKVKVEGIRRGKPLTLEWTIK